MTIDRVRSLYDSSSSSSAKVANKVICTCWGSESPAVWLSATCRLSATIRSMKGMSRVSVEIVS